ncbi:TonB-dependent siderophore receptor [Caulobacter sp. UNC358MFTsu5.1]|uniref:TonB-dependent receptor n=1 Tax=Caulobacter sp. UNC358MFTsu5.1 TaxID=1449049 RepID=UPI0004A75F77|nr:TonB-dependent siderophore receptor [Caulobacter sp. UNC358MFTsu5.1]
MNKSSKPAVAGVRSQTRAALGVAAVAGLAGLSLAPAAFAAAPEADAAADAAIATAGPADSATEVSGVKVDGKRNAEVQSPKLTAPLVDTPKAITVIPRKIIEQTAATSLQDILRTSPGITFGAGEGGQPLADRPFIRGQSSANDVFVDGLRDSGGQTREVFNLEQVEVVKGPDSAYSGRGSGGGSINLTSKSPKADDFVRASIAGGTDSYVRATADLNHQINDSVAVRLNLLGTQGDTPGRDAVDFDRWGAAASIAAGLDGPTQMTLSYYHLDSNAMPDYGIPLFTKVPGVPRTDSGILDVDYSSFYGLKARDYQKTKADIATFAVDHAINSNLGVRQVVRWSKTLNDYIVTNPGDGGAAQLIGGQWWMKRGTKTRWNPVETMAANTDFHGKFDTGAFSHSFDLGIELSREENLNATYSTYTTSGSACPAGFNMGTNATNLGQGDCTLVYAPNPNDPWTGIINRSPANRNVSKTAAIYGFDTIKFGDRWLLNLGLRHDHYESAGYDYASFTQNQGAFSGGTITYRQGEWDFTSYQAGLVFKPTEDSSLYISYGTASTPPGVQGGDQNSNGITGTVGTTPNQLLEPEDTESFEAGGKWTLFNDTLALSGAVFKTTRKNALIQINNGVFAQVGETQVKGVELGISGNITPKWQAFGGYTYMDSELVHGAVTIQSGTGAIIPNINEGDPLANTPKNSFSLFTTYRVTRKLSAGGGAYYVSKMFGGNQGGAGGGTNAVYAPDYWRFDAFASYVVNDKVDLQLNVQNVGDERYIMRTNGVHHADPAPGRQAILTLNVKY